MGAFQYQREDLNIVNTRRTSLLFLKVMQGKPHFLIVAWIWLLPALLKGFNCDFIYGQASGESSSLTPRILDVSVYYEALCPDSRHFINRHLQPVYQKLSSYLNLNLIPYGKAFTKMQDGRPVFTCQHGPLECEANRVHACAIAHISSATTRLAYVHCMILDNFEPQTAGSKCAEQLGVSWDPIRRCILSEEGEQLLKLHGDATHALRPKAGFIPTITIDQSHEDQVGILKNFQEVICSRFGERRPKECT